ncbi:MAG TPA: extracellular solute-binding protein, partial [Puia sp.]|nr:extracellular solute-binding protein [Puia sp.]
MPIKKILSFLIASFVAFFLGGCGGPPTVATISIIGENSSTLQAMMSLKDSFESRNPSIHLQFNPNTFEEARTKSDQDFVEKKGQYDIILQYNFTLSSSVRNNYVYMINDLTKDIPAEKKSFESDIFPNLWNELGYYYNDALNPTAGKKMVSYPYIGISMVLMYNKPMFENEANKADYQKKYGQPLNVPSSWEDMLKAAEFFTDRQKGTFGICMEGAAFYLNP